MPNAVMIAPDVTTADRRPWWAAQPWECGALPWDVPAVAAAPQPPRRLARVS